VYFYEFEFVGRTVLTDDMFIRRLLCGCPKGNVRIIVPWDFDKGFLFS